MPPCQNNRNHSSCLTHLVIQFGFYLCQPTQFGLLNNRLEITIYSRYHTVRMYKTIYSVYTLKVHVELRNRTPFDSLPGNRIMGVPPARIVSPGFNPIIKSSSGRKLSAVLFIYQYSHTSSAFDQLIHICTTIWNTQQLELLTLQTDVTGHI